MTSPVAVVLAAGKGTRMKSALPKVLFPLLGTPIVQRVVEAAQAAGCGEVVAVIGHGAERVEETLAHAEVRFAVQHTRRGTGDAVAAARPALDDWDRPVLILPGDVPRMRAETLRSLIAAHAASGAAVTVGTMLPPDPSGYGRIVRDGDSVQAIVEHRDCTEEQRAIGECNTGLYVAHGAFLFGTDGRPGALDRLTTDNDQGELYLTDIVGIARADGLTVAGVVIDDPGEVEGINDRVQLAAMEQGARQRAAVRWMRAGVSMDDPDEVRIEDAVVLGTDVVLGADVELRGACRIADGAVIARGCVLTDVVVGEGARVGPYVVAERAIIEAGAIVRPFTVITGFNEKRPHLTTEADRVRIGPGAKVGPFSHLRQGSHLEDDVHVGNFVELKTTTMHPGAKANHLAYLGDADIGSRANIGAGVITCNYDGFAKHKTTIGAGAFIGTDSHLVAPVTVGDGAYVATGTTVTKNVPADALAIGRARQENKPGRATKLKELLRRRAEAAKQRG
jgi:bifunctional UDP-N-acetylglucosamine pyrophosphorylase/glucosamine-1-phosphate N-acetyltransferase